MTVAASQAWCWVQWPWGVHLPSVAGMRVPGSVQAETPLHPWILLVLGWDADTIGTQWVEPPDL